MLKFRKFLVFILAFVASVSLFSAYFSAVNVYASEDLWQVSSTLTKDAEGAYVNTSPAQASHSVEYVGADINKANTAEFDIQYTQSSSENGAECYIGWQIFYGPNATDYYIFKICFNIGYGENAVALLNQFVTTHTRHAFNKKVAYQDWVNVKITTVDGALNCYVDGQIIASYNGINNMVWKRAIAHIYSVPAKIKNLKVYEKSATSYEEGWHKNDFVTEKDGVYTSTVGNSALEYKSQDLSKYNTIEAEFNYTGSSSSNMEYIALQMNSASDYYLFSVWPNTASPSSPPKAFVQKNTNDPISKITSYSLNRQTHGAGKWFKLKAIIENGYFAFYVDDILVGQSDDVGHMVMNFNLQRALITTNGCPAQFRNPKIYYTDIAGNTEEGLKINSNVQETEKDGQKIYKTNKNGIATIEYVKKSYEDVNTITANLNYQGNSSSNIEYVGIRIYTETDYYTFAIWPNSAADSNAVTLIQRNSTDPINRLVRLAHVTGEIKANVDINIKVILQDGYFAYYLNGEKLCDSDKALCDVGEANWTSVQVVSENCPATVSDIELSYNAPDYSDFVDFSFEDKRGALAMKATNATIEALEGKLVANVTGSSPVIESPVIQTMPGHKYSAKLCVRNTFVVRLKNSTDADSVILSYTDKINDEYNSVMQKEFSIIPNSDYTTYYFNISDTVNCEHWRDSETLKLCNHYLTAFKMAFEGAEDGVIEIEEISFEREDMLYDYAAESMTAIADKENGTVVVQGKLKEQYSGYNVTVMTTIVENYNEFIDHSGNKIVAMAKAKGCDFKVTFSLNNGELNHLPSKFLAVASNTENYHSGVKLSKVFMIDNWRDFSENQYDFTLPNLTVDVTEERFGAKGDGFTNDTKAIQKAIDFVNAQGGGKVVVPGDDGLYGRRYVITNVEIKSNVEFYIEEGAILWQSHQRSDYTDYEVYIGHENMGENVAWGLSSLMHLPFIYIHDAQNVKVTGGGTLRMDDTGTEWLNGWGYTWNSNITVGCTSVVHLVPIGIYGCQNVEISDVNIRRASCWHSYIRESSNVFFGNVDMKEVNCINGDGLDFSTAVHDVLIERCSLYSNDDAIVLAVTTNDPRDDLSIWRAKSTKEDKSVYNFTIKHCNMLGGHGLTFIPWASEAPDFSKVEIRDVYAENNIFNMLGAWADNPFYGLSNYWDGTYGLDDHTEPGDYSSIKNITVVNNKIASTSFYGINATNVITDEKFHGATNFENGNFDKVIYKGHGHNDETDYVMGLAYWGTTGNTGTEAVGKRQTVTADTKEQLTVNNYAGYIKGDGSLYQGIYNLFGSYKASVKTAYTEGKAILFIENSITGEIIAEKEILPSQDFSETTLDYAIESSCFVTIGVRYSGEETQTLYLDDANVLINYDDDYYNVEGTVTENNFDKDYSGFKIYSSAKSVYVSEEGKLVAEEGAEHKIMFNGKVSSEYRMSVDISVLDNYNVNAGVYIASNNPSSNPDIIDAYNVQIESNKGSGEYLVKIFKFSRQNGYLGLEASSAINRIKGDKINLDVLFKNNTIIVFTDGQKTPTLVYEVSTGLIGGVGLRSQAERSEFDNFKITVAPEKIPTDTTKLEQALQTAKGIELERYTQESVDVLLDAMQQAENISKDATQEEIDRVEEALKSAMQSLEEKPTESEEPSESETPSEPATDTDSQNPSDSQGKKGCGSSMSSIWFSILIVLALTILIKKRYGVSKNN